MNNSYELLPQEKDIGIEKISPGGSFEKRNITFYILRLDKNHKYIQGNKWYKLKFNIKKALEYNYNTLLTFGGAYSNHIIATAVAARLYGLKSVGIIRGGEIKELNPKLKFAHDHGMQLEFIDRDKYRNKYDQTFLDNYENKYGNFYLIPEGGTNNLALQGCKEIAGLIPCDIDYVCLSCGTGGTMAGIINGLSGSTFTLGFSSLKGGEFLRTDIHYLLDQNNIKNNNWDINTDYHFGGFAKSSLNLKNFIKYFEDSFQIPLEHVYTGKLLYGLFDMVEKGLFPKDSKVLAIHTGGIFSF